MRTDLRFAFLLAICSCSKVVDLNIPFPSKQQSGTEVLYVEHDGQAQAFALSLESDYHHIPMTLEPDGLIHLEAMLFDESPQELKISSVSPELPPGVEGRAPIDVFELDIREGEAGDWIPTAEPGPNAARFLPAPGRNACASFLSDIAYIFPPARDPGRRSFIGAFAIDETTALVVLANENSEPLFYRARVSAAPEQMQTGVTTFLPRVAERSRGINWIAGTQQGVPVMATYSVEAGLEILPGRTPIFRHLSPAGEDDAYALYGIDGLAGVYGYRSVENEWELLGRLDNLWAGSHGRLARLGDGELLAVDNEGCGLHHVPGQPSTQEKTPFPLCSHVDEIVEPFSALNHLPGVGSFAGTAKEQLFRRDPETPSWTALELKSAFLTPDHELLWFEPYVGGFLIGGSHGTVQQYLLDDERACNDEPIVAVVNYAFVQKIITLKDGWVVAGRHEDPQEGVRRAFISSFIEL